MPTIDNILDDSLEEETEREIQGYMNSIFENISEESLRGWILPNGIKMKQYYFKGFLRKDHGRLVELFMKGLSIFDEEAYERLMVLFDKYVVDNYNVSDPYESFAVEKLGWIQVSECGSNRLICLEERWQDKFIGPFINTYGYELVISNNGKSYEDDFEDAWENVKEIILLGLKDKYSIAPSGMHR